MILIVIVIVRCPLNLRGWLVPLCPATLGEPAAPHRLLSTVYGLLLP